uniref:Pleckstrin homology domain containing, family O member 2 n=1 Tax=Gasterosteus aculeatus TaxID=69293 RepID=G3PND6_GASAC
SQGAKEEPAQRKEPKFLSKAGWVKKAPGRLLASYKDRYVHVERTEIVVYENEDLQNCLERVNLENYDKCHELKSPFKKKHRLVLIRSPRPGNKVHDVKFQAQTREKEAWIKALTDGINRAKNKVFDDVTIDNSINLEHVTRTRPKGNRNRRPPTRMHMKFIVADVSSDGILRLDLNLEDAVMPNGTCRASDDKKVIKPPMPPIKEAKPCPTPEAEPDKEDGPEKKVLKPPMPPSNKAKPCASPLGDATEEDDKPESPGVVRHISEEEPEEAAGSDLSKASDTEPQIPTETLGKSLSPPMIPKKKSEKPVQPDTPHTGNNANVTQINEGRDPTASPPTASDTSAGSPQAEEALPNEDEIPIRLMPTKVPPKPQVRPRVFPSRKPRPPLLLKPSDKAKSASIGDLLSSVNVPARQNTADVAAGNGAPGANVMKLETEVAQEMEKTRDLMSKVSRSQNGGDRKDKTEDLLARAMENLEKADHVLREVNKLKVAN